MSKKNIVIIGAGFAGLAAAALLAHAGYSVTVLEKNHEIGGRARVFRSKGFQFDRGPSWYMMPEIFEKFFARFGKKPSDFYDLVQLDPSYQLFFENEAAVILSADSKQNESLFDALEPGAGKRLHSYLERTRKVYEIATSEFMYQDFSDWRNWFSLKTVATGLHLFRLVNPLQSWATMVARRFRDSRLQKILTFPAVFLGGSPYLTPSLFSMLSWADMGKGIWYPIGGMTKVIEALASVARSQGTKIHTSAEVTAIEVHKGKVQAVHTATTTFACDYLIGATDIAHLQTLLPESARDFGRQQLQKKTIAISAVLAYIGLSKKIPAAVHHTLFFSDDWKEHFDAIFTSNDLPEKPSFYASFRSRTDSSIVPKGSEELFLLIPVKAQLGQSKELYEQLIDQAIRTLEEKLDTDLSSSISVRHIYTPDDFATDYNAYHGTALGLAHTLSQSLFSRPSIHSRKLSNLFYAGQWTYPGVGVPMAIVSAQIVAQAIDTYDKT